MRISRRDLLKLLPLLALGPLLTGERDTAAEQRADGPSFLILVFDTLSACHLPLYGYRRDTAPHLTRFAERAVVYRSCHAPANFTSPSTASLLTGTYPWSHRALHHAGTVREEAVAWNLFRALEGYYRLAFSNNLWVDLLLHQFRRDLDLHIPAGSFALFDGEARGRAFPNDQETAFRALEDLLVRGVSFPASLFLGALEQLGVISAERLLGQRYAESYPRGLPTEGMYDVFFLLEDVIDGVVESLRRIPRPFVAYLHFFPPHEPYRPRQEFIGLFADGWGPEDKGAHFFSQGYTQAELNRLRREYDEYIAYTDAEFGRLYGMLEGAGLLEDCCLVLTSDHGQLFERGVHGHDTTLLYEPVVRVPLLIAGPGQREREEVDVPVSGVDLFPTLLSLAGRPIPDWCEGRVLPPFGGPGRRDIFALEAKSSPRQGPLSKGTMMVYREPYKLIRYFGYEGYEDEWELYDLANDPEERENLYLREQGLAAELWEAAEGMIGRDE